MLALGALLSALFLFLTLRRIPHERLLQEIGQASLPILSLVLITKLVFFLLATCRTWLLLSAWRRHSFGTLFRSHLIGFAANNALPLRAGELVRLDYLARTGDLPHATCAPLVLVERLFDVVALAALLLAILPAAAETIPIGASAYVGSAVALVGLALAEGARRRPALLVSAVAGAASLLGERVHAFVHTKSERFAAGFAAVPSLWVLLGAAAVSLSAWLTGALSVQIWLWAFGVEAAWYAPALVLVCLAFGTAIPSTPGHIGTYHFFAVAGLTAAGVDAAAATSIAIVGHAASVLPYTLIALPVLLRSGVEGPPPAAAGVAPAAAGSPPPEVVDA